MERSVERALGGRRPDLVVAKSFGCCALPWAVRNGIAGVWLTPVCTLGSVAHALAVASATDVAVGGSADPLWQPDAIGGGGARRQTVDGADHALEVRGDWRRSQRLQAEVLDLVEGRIAALRAV